MSKKKHPEHVNHERWLVSYADFITLLFAFFVVLFASGQSDKRKQVKLAEAMQTAFAHNGIFDPHTKTPPVSDDAGASGLGAPLPLALPVPVEFDAKEGDGPALAQRRVREAAAADRIRSSVAREIDRHTLHDGMVTLRSSEEGLVVSLREAGFFDSGSATVRPESLETLRRIVAALPGGAMRVEGHTDNVPIHTAQFATNWELSTARAASITRLLIGQGAVLPGDVAAAGLAEFHPTADNATEAGRRENRRVDIVLLRPSVPAATAATTAATPAAFAPAPPPAGPATLHASASAAPKPSPRGS